MKSKVTSSRNSLFVTSCCCLFLLLAQLVNCQADLLRLTRQANSNRIRARQQVSIESQQPSSNVSGSIASSSSSLASASNGQPEFNNVNSNKRPPIGGTAELDSDSFPSKNERPKPQRKPKVNRRPQIHESNNNDDEFDEDCDYSDNPFAMAFNPMRQFRRMMNNVFDRMASNYSDEEEYEDGYGNSPRGSVAMSSAFNGGDGYSRLASSVSNNGRTRGIISETRNGRTSVRKIGDDDTDTDQE